MLGRPRPDSYARQSLPPLAAAIAIALLALGLALPAAAGAAASGESPLSAELEALATPAVASQPVPAQAEAAGLPAEGPGSLSREGDRVVVEARFDEGAISQLEALQAAGARVLVADARYQTVALSIAPEDLGALAEVPGVASVAAALRPVVYGAGEEAVGTRAVESNGLCEGGSVISQGLAQLQVPAARSAYGARGAGLTIGVISDSYDSATTAIGGGTLATRAGDDETSNDLPGPASTCSGQQTPVNVIKEAPSSPTSHDTDEGRAMLQVVHDVAPHAKLAFATALPNELAFAQNIEQLARPVAAGGAGAQVIVDDIGYTTEPFFQDGPVAVAIRKVTGEGVTYLTAAGNENLRDALGRNIGSWEAPAFRPMACPAEVTALPGQASNTCMNFSPSGSEDSKFGIKVAPGAEAVVDLQWAEPWYGVKTDLDAFLVDQSGEILTEYEKGEGTIDSTTFGEPIEVVGWENGSNATEEVFLVIDRCAVACNSAAISGTPRLKFEFIDDSDVTGIEYPTSTKGDVVGPTIYGHAGAAAAISVGAIRFNQSATTPKEPEPFSSRGPVTHYFEPVLGTVPAAAHTEAVAKPDLTATDCASTTFFAQLQASSWYFCGTSEAAPHAAAVAALMKQTSPSASPTAIREAMRSSATKYTPASTANSSEAVGAGLLNAAGALSALGGSPVSDPPSSVVAPLGPTPAPVESPAAVVEAPAKAAATAPPPTVELTRKPGSPTDEKRPTFEFRASGPVTFSCQVDGGAAKPCTSPYTVPSPLGDGGHSFVVTGTDAQGHSGSSGAYAFTVDTGAPTVKFVKEPKRLLRARRSIVVRFGLRADESPVTFYCQVDKEPLRACPASFARRFGKGSHVVRVKAQDAAGNLTARWAVYAFRVKPPRPARPPRRR